MEEFYFGWFDLGVIVSRVDVLSSCLIFSFDPDFIEPFLGSHHLLSLE